MAERRALSVLVEDKPGVLSRVSGLFTRRNFNIHSLAVGPTEHPDRSRITVVVDVEDSSLEQVTKQLNKLVNVIKIIELEEGESVLRELMLIKVSADAHNRIAVVQVADLFRAHVVDVSPDVVTIEATGSPAKLRALVEALNPYGVREMVKSGAVGISRGLRTLTDKTLERSRS